MPGFVSLVHGIVRWVLGFVFWVLGFVFWVLGFVFWVSGLCLLGVWTLWRPQTGESDNGLPIQVEVCL